MTFKQDDTLFTQSTFLEGCDPSQSERLATHLGDFTESAVRESELLEISQKQVSWFAACTLLGSFLLFIGGYQIGKLQKTSQAALLSEHLVPESLVTANYKKISSLGQYAAYEDAVSRYNELKSQGKTVYLTKKTSRSVAGVERFWYLVSEGEITTLKGNCI